MVSHNKKSQTICVGSCFCSDEPANGLYVVFECTAHNNILCVCQVCWYFYTGANDLNASLFHLQHQQGPKQGACCYHLSKCGCIYVVESILLSLLLYIHFRLSACRAGTLTVSPVVRGEQECEYIQRLFQLLYCVLTRIVHTNQADQTFCCCNAKSRKATHMSSNIYCYSDIAPWLRKTSCRACRNLEEQPPF